MERLDTAWHWHSIAKQWFISRARSAYDIDISDALAHLEQQRYPETHPGHAIAGAIERLMAIHTLGNEELQRKFDQLGFFLDRYLRLYLVSTCFDILGQTQEYMTFEAWLGMREASRKAADRNEIISESLASGVQSSADLIHCMKKVHTTYLRQYGMKNSFTSFFERFVSDVDKAMLTTQVWLADNPNAPLLPGDLFMRPQPPDWLALSQDAKLNKILTKLVELCRNAFTHKGQAAFDVFDRDPVYWGTRFIGSEERAGRLKYTLQHVDDISKFDDQGDYPIRMTIAGTPLRMGMKGSLHFFGVNDTRAREILANLLQDCAARFQIGGHLYFRNNRIALCYKDIILTHELIRLAELGAIARIQDEHSQLE